MLSTLVWYLAGNLGVLLLAYVIYLRFAPRQPNLGKRLKHVLQVRDRKKRIEAAQQEIRNSEAEQKQLEDEIKILEEIIGSRVQVQENDETNWVEWMFLGLAVFLIYLDSGVFLLLSAGSHLLQLPVKVWAFSAFGVAVATQLVLHISLKYPVYVQDRPEATRHRAEVGTFVTVICVAVSIYLALAGRNISDPGALQATVETGLLGLVLFVAVSGAFAWWAWSSYFHERRPVRELRGARHLDERYGRHIECLKDDIDRTKGEGPGFSALGVMVATSFLTFILILLPPLLARSPSSSAGVAAGFGKTPLVHTGFPHVRARQIRPLSAVAPAAQSGLARLHGCEFPVDVSASDNGPVLRATVNALAGNLPLVVSTFDCAKLRITAFAADVFTPLSEVNLASTSDPATACGPVPGQVASGLLGAVAELYPQVAQNLRQNKERSCEVQRDKASKALLAQRQAALHHAATILRAAGQLPPAGPCTAVLQVIGRALQRSKDVIVVSDFDQTCAPPLSPIIIPQDSWMVFLVIPPQGRIDKNTANILLAHIAALHKIFPSAIAVLASEATPDFWRGLTVQPSPRSDSRDSPVPLGRNDSEGRSVITNGINGVAARRP